ncbi:MAG TPA: 50S ribosomal protein L9 [Peptococcaceae bacterium]|nr:MAG: 50S ribosomal protein L9 [Clostridia bacterium 41_269]HBT19856.1 50S ribosomal protein L9 [Peptococcaceae bacterium]
MKVILKAEVENLGKEGDVLEVADGYGRNYLLPRGLAVLATPQNLKQLEKKIKAREEQKKQELEQARQLAAKINETTIVIRAKVGEKGKLYGSITNNDVAAKLSEQGIEVDKRKIDLKDPIKEVGFYTIGIKVHPEVYAELRVQVEAEKEENKQEEEEQGEEK